MPASARVPRWLAISVQAALLLLWPAALVLYWWLSSSDANSHTLGALTLSYLVVWGGLFFWSDAPRQVKATRFVLASTCLGLFVALCEFLALGGFVDFRIVFGTVAHEPWRNPRNLLDPRLLYIHRPHEHFKWGGQEYRYDEHGLRNATDLAAADVVVVGDSFIEGIGVSAADLITTRLAAQIRRPVANVAQSWYGPQQELELLRRFGLPLQPKICLWVFFEGNDLQDVDRYENDFTHWPERSKEIQSYHQRCFTRNALLAVRRLVSERPRGNTATDQEQSGVFVDASGQKQRLYFWYQGRRRSDADDRALEKLTGILGEARSFCAAQGVHFGVVFLPDKFRVYGELSRFKAGARPLEWVHNDLPQRLAETVRTRLPGTGFLDLTPVLTQEAKAGSLVYQTYDSHWSSEGHRVAATEIAAFLHEWLGDDEPLWKEPGIGDQQGRSSR